MLGRKILAFTAALGVTALGPAAAAADPGVGNSGAAHACQQGGYLSLVGAGGQTFANAGQCTSFAAHGGRFATGIVIPAGHTATLSGAHWTNPPCDALSYGYQIDLGANSPPLGTKPAGCFVADLPGAVVGPFPTATLLRVYLTDSGNPAGSCSDTFYSDGSHALVTGTNPYDVSISDSFLCLEGPGTSRVPPSPGQGNLEVTVTIS